MTPHERTQVDLEHAAASARSAAVTAERFGYLLAVIVGGALVAIGGWIVSIPLAIAAYMLIVKPYHKAVERAEEALQRHIDSAPLSTGY